MRLVILLFFSLVVFSCGGGGDSGNNSSNNRENKENILPSYVLYGEHMENAVGVQVSLVFDGNVEEIKAGKDTNNWEIKERKKENHINIIMFNPDLKAIKSLSPQILKIKAENIRINSFKIVDEFGNEIKGSSLHIEKD